MRAILICDIAFLVRIVNIRFKIILCIQIKCLLLSYKNDTSLLKNFVKFMNNFVITHEFHKMFLKDFSNHDAVFRSHVNTCKAL